MAWRRDEGPRTYLRLDSPVGELFAWSTRDPREFPMVERELSIRAAVGTDGPLRAPPLLARGDGWRLERWIRSEPLAGARAIQVAVDAARVLARLTLPAAPPADVERRRHTVMRRIRTALSPLPVRDYLAARRLLATTKLEPVTSHGDFHPIHLLFADGAMWVIDWDLAGCRPAGFDLMQLWTTLERDDRDLLYEQALAFVGPGNEVELARMRFVVLIQMIASCFAERHEINRDPERGHRLLELLPEVRAEARA